MSVRAWLAHAAGPGRFGSSAEVEVSAGRCAGRGCSSGRSRGARSRAACAPARSGAERPAGALAANGRSDFGDTAPPRRRRPAGTCERARVDGRRRGGLPGALERLRRRAEPAVGAGLAPAGAALLRGMVLGEDEADRSGRARGLPRQRPGSPARRVGPERGAAGGARPSGAGAGRRRRRTHGCSALAGLVAVYVPLAGAGPSLQRAGVMGAGRDRGHGGLAPGARAAYALLLAAVVTLACEPEGGGGSGMAALVRRGRRASSCSGRRSAGDDRRRWRRCCRDRHRRRHAGPPVAWRLARGGGRHGHERGGHGGHGAAAGAPLRPGAAGGAAGEPAGAAGGGAGHVAGDGQGRGGPARGARPAGGGARGAAASVLGWMAGVPWATSRGWPERSPTCPRGSWHAEPPRSPAALLPCVRAAARGGGRRPHWLRRAARRGRAPQRGRRLAGGGCRARGGAVAALLAPRSCWSPGHRGRARRPGLRIVHRPLPRRGPGRRHADPGLRRRGDAVRRRAAGGGRLRASCGGPGCAALPRWWPPTPRATITAGWWTCCATSRWACSSTAGTAPRDPALPRGAERRRRPPVRRVRRVTARAGSASRRRGEL